MSSREGASGPEGVPSIVSPSGVWRRVRCVEAQPCARPSLSTAISVCNGRVRYISFKVASGYGRCIDSPRARFLRGSPLRIVVRGVGTATAVKGMLSGGLTWVNAKGGEALPRHGETTQLSSWAGPGNGIGRGEQAGWVDPRLGSESQGLSCPGTSQLSAATAATLILAAAEAYQTLQESQE
jgi:hypothetical protein